MAKEKKKKLHIVLMVIGIILLVLIAAGAGIFFYIRSQFAPPRVEIGEPSDAAIVETTGGTVRGYISNDIYTYHGIPYGSAPERFVAAQPVEHWEGILDAVDYGPISPQGSLFGSGGNVNAEGTANDCLNLNIWTPSINDGEKRAVMVWFHGGGFSTGSGNDATYDGEAMAAYGDVVVVDVNHRLNVFGYMDLSAYGDKYANGGNQGLTDLVMALQWVQDNIAQFGGDPDNVTIFGQSGGGAKVLALMTVPEAQGLFTKGIVQSGATDTMGLTFATKEQSLALTEHILDALGITEENIEDIQSVPESELQDAANSALQATGSEFQIPAALSEGYAMEWGPVVDGAYLPTDPVTEDGFAEAGRDIPLLIGSNLNEWAMAGASPSEGEVTDEIQQAFNEAYPNETPSEITSLDTLLRYPLLKITRHKAMQSGAPVYSYVFAYDDNAGGAYHGAEIPYVFHHSGGALNDIMTQVWVNFAKTGVPGADGLPEWETYDMEQGATMILDTESYLAYHHDMELLQLLKPSYDLD